MTMDGLAHVEWRKSTRSSGNAACIEVAGLPTGGRAVRDSKNSTGAALMFTAAEWTAFTAGVKSGDFD
jgi:hypothetical protein